METAGGSQRRIWALRVRRDVLITALSQRRRLCWERCSFQLASRTLHCCRRALHLWPEYPDAHNNLGIILLEQGRPSEAAASFQRSLQLKPAYAEASNNLGNVLLQLGNPEDAAAAYQQAVLLQPDYAQAHFGLGVALQHRGDVDEAVGSYRRGLELDPKFAPGHNRLGALLGVESSAVPHGEARQVRIPRIDAVPDREETKSLAERRDR